MAGPLLTALFPCPSEAGLAGISGRALGHMAHRGRFLQWRPSEQGGQV